MATYFVEFARLTDATVLQGAEHVPALALAKDLLDPDMYGYAVTAEVHNRPRRVLGTVLKLLRNAAISPKVWTPNSCSKAPFVRWARSAIGQKQTPRGC